MVRALALGLIALGLACAASDERRFARATTQPVRGAEKSAAEEPEELDRSESDPDDRPMPEPRGSVVTETCSLPAAPRPGAVVRRPGLAYRQLGQRVLRLDLVAPPGPARHPLVMLVHGGGWRAGERGHLADEIDRLATLGYAAASIDYRLAPEHRFPAAVSDVRCAIRFVRVEADRLGIDPTRVAAIGFSAGGHLVALTALGDDPALDDVACEHEASPVPDAWVAYFAPFDLTDVSRWPQPAARVLVERFLGGRPEDGPERAAAASPLLRVRARVAPALLVHGTSDAVVPVTQSVRMRDRLKGTASAVDLVVVPGAGHGFRLFAGDPELRTASCSTIAFLQRFRTRSLISEGS